MERLGYGGAPDYDDDDDDAPAVQEQTSQVLSFAKKDEDASHGDPDEQKNLDFGNKTVEDTRTPAERRALMERSSWSKDATGESTYDKSVFQAQHSLLAEALTDAKKAGDATDAHHALRDALGYPRSLSEEDSTGLLDDLAAHPQKNDANELTIHRLTELVLLRADDVDVGAATKMEHRINDPSLNGWPIYQDIKSADQLRESALEAFASGDVQALRELDAAYGLDIHNITDAAAARCATHWNNDPPAADADVEEAGNYLRLRFNAWTVEHGLHPVFSDTQEAERSIDRFAQEISVTYDKENDLPTTVLRTQQQQAQLENTLKWYFFDDGTPEHLGQELIKAAQIRATGDFNRQLADSL